MRLDSSTFKLYEYHSSRYLICQSQHKMDTRPYLNYMVLCLIAVSCNFNRTKGPRQDKEYSITYKKNKNDFISIIRNT